MMDGRTDGRADGRTDGRMDGISVYGLWFPPFTALQQDRKVFLFDVFTSLPIFLSLNTDWGVGSVGGCASKETVSRYVLFQSVFFETIPRIGSLHLTLLFCLAFSSRLKLSTSPNATKGRHLKRHKVHFVSDTFFSQLSE
ncbi:hypothetical protein ATANTOWER_012631 [Ataeniobius toweri]|uniref:Transmembrane protein n=1 Tax=Ataeniobius toweri TaxID=208326 RepID=A0ABU7A6V8_9TELE|nr:hypothetical protein [Ataeniobius toweri]